MECISTSFAPIIVQPESGHDWAQQHILGEQIHLGQTKQQPPTSSPSSSTSSSNNNNNNNNNTNFPMNQWSPRQSAGRRRNLPTTNTLQIPGAGAQRPGARPALKTPVKLGERSRDEWEALLTGSLASLQGAYARLQADRDEPPQPPPAPRRQSLPSGARTDTDRPDVAGLDRAEVASRALQAAAGCHVMFPAQLLMASPMMGTGRLGGGGDDDVSSDAGSSSGSEDSFEAPATPVEEMQLDPRLFS